jgi:hypothetical protein
MYYESGGRLDTRGYGMSLDELWKWLLEEADLDDSAVSLLNSLANMYSGIPGR